MIYLKDGWAIDVDGIQYILGKPTESMVKGRAVKLMLNATYHATVEQAVTSFLRRIQREQIRTHDYSLEQAFTALIKAKSEVLELTGELEAIKHM